MNFIKRIRALFSAPSAKNKGKEPIAESAPPVGSVESRNLKDYEQISGYYRNPDNISIPEYRKMISTDETIAASVEFVSLAVTSRLGDYVNPDYPEIQEFIRKNFELMSGSLTLSVKAMLEALWAGFSILEIVTEYKDDKIYLHSLQPVRPESVKMHVCNDGGLNHGQVDEIIQWPQTAYEVRIPANKCIHFVNVYSGCEATNPYGRSRLKSIYKNWFLKDRTLEAWGLTLERYGSPLILYKVDKGSILVTAPDGRTMTQSAYAQEVINSLRTSSGIVYEGGSTIEVRYGLAVGNDFEQVQTHCNRMIMRGLLLPSLTMDNGDVGSYALGKAHFNLFLLGLDHILQNVTETLLEQLVRPLIEWNFGEVDNFGFFHIIEQPDDVKLWAEIFALMTQSHVISPDVKADLDYMRDKVGLPPAEEGATWTDGTEPAEDGKPGTESGSLALPSTASPPERWPVVKETPYAAALREAIKLSR